MSDLITRLRDVMDSRGYNQSDVARAIGKSPAVISTFFNNVYKGDLKKLETELETFIERETEKKKNKRINAEFVPTPNAKRGLEVIRMAHVDSDINVITGAAGLGKTMIMREYARRYPDAILIEADPGYTARVLLEELCKRLNQSTRGTIHDMSENCIKALQDSGRAILIDEAELLPHRALEVLRRIHDKANVGVCLAGMPRLILNLKGRRGEYAQLYSRVGFCMDLREQLPKDDLKVMLLNMLPDINDEKVIDKFYTAANGNARRMFKLARGVQRASEINDRPVDCDMVSRMREMLIN